MRTLIPAALLLAGSAAVAQTNTTTITPGVPIERFNLPPSTSQTPTPSPTPSATLTPAPPPSVIPTLQRPPSARLPTATPTPRVAPAQPRPVATPTPAPTPTPRQSSGASPQERAPEQSRPPGDAVPTPAASPILTAPTPLETPVATPTPEAVAPPEAGGVPSWLFWLAGIAVIAGAGLFAWRRLRRADDEAIEYAPPPEALPAGEPAPAVPTPSPPAKPVGAAPAAARSDRALVLDLRPQRLWTRGPDAFLAFELIVTNTGANTADGVRPLLALASAGPDTAREVAQFLAGAPGVPGGEPFDLRAGESRRVTGELTLSGDHMYVTAASDREMIVPLALVSVKWRSGLAVVSAGDAFIVGTGTPASPRLGPIWVDRAGLSYETLDARRFTVGQRG